MSSADAGVAYAAEASPRIIAMGIANLFVLFDPDRGENNGCQCRRTEAVSEVSRPSLRTGPEQKPATAVRPAMRAIIMPPLPFYRPTAPKHLAPQTFSLHIGDRDEDRAEADPFAQI